MNPKNYMSKDSMFIEKGAKTKKGEKTNLSLGNLLSFAILPFSVNGEEL